MSREHIAHLMGKLALGVDARNRVSHSTKSFDYSDMEIKMTRILLPNHEQHFPYKLIPHRLEEYIFDDGRPPTTDRAFAKRVVGKTVKDLTVSLQSDLKLSNIDARYFVGTCFHESGCINEWDTEIATTFSNTGFQSVGAYQIGKEEAEHFGFKLEDMLMLRAATQCMIKLAENNRTQLRMAAKISNNVPDPDYTDADGVIWPGGAMRAYLAICHNHGIGYARATITRYGLDWGAYKQRNPTDNIVAHSYGEDCITGGPNYPSEDNSNPRGDTLLRIIKLTRPYMTGNDVRELQRHLKITADGIFGPGTEAALIQFQRSHELVGDGICGTETWDELITV